MRRKVLVGLLLAGLLLSMAACATTRNPIDTLPSEIATEAATTQPATEAATTQPATEPATTQPTSELENSFRHSTPQGSEYLNDFLKLGFSAPEGWTFYTDELLLQMNGLTDSAFTDENVEEILANNIALIEMSAADVIGNNVNLVIQDMGLFAGISDEQMLAEANIMGVESMLESAGYEIDFCRLGKTTFCGEEKPCIEVQASYTGVKITELQTYSIIGNYAVFVTMTASGQEADDGMAYLHQLAEQFYMLEQQP